VRALISLPMILLVGCSSVLGIDDPKPVIDSGAPPPDVTTTSTDRLTVSLTDIKIAQGQRVRIRVQLVHLDGNMQDVTASATFTSDDTAIATSGGPGLIDGGTKPGLATLTAHVGTAITTTVKATVTATTCRPVINELTTGVVGAADNEWVELYNPCSTPVSVAGWTLIYRAATATGLDSGTLVTLAGTMDPGALRLYSGTGYPGTTDDDAQKWSSTLQQNDGAVGLRNGAKDVGVLQDSVAYGAAVVGNPFIEATATPAMANGLSASRKLFDGNDSNNNNADFVIQTTATPRALNVP
jgi:hypothetical protein